MAVNVSCLVEFIGLNLIEPCLQAKAVGQLLAVQLHHTTATASHAVPTNTHSTTKIITNTYIQRYKGHSVGKPMLASSPQFSSDSCSVWNLLG